RVAGGLRASGVRPGDRVAVRLPNGADWVVAFFGAQLAGAVAVPVNTRFSETEVAYVVADSGAREVIDGSLPDGAPFAFERRVDHRSGGDRLHQRHDGVPQGGDAPPLVLPGDLREPGAGHRH